MPSRELSISELQSAYQDLPIAPQESHSSEASDSHFQRLAQFIIGENRDEIERDYMNKRSTNEAMLSVSLISTITFCVLLVLFLSGCSSKGSGGPEDGEGSGDMMGLSQAELDSELARRYGDGSIPAADSDGVFKDVRFGFDSATLNEVSRDQIRYNADIIKANPGIKIQLEGHCDERGTSEYNLALGQRRAQSVYDQLISYGIPRTNIETISYGSEIPLDSSSSEAAWAKNRRVHFTPFREARAGS